MRKFTLLALFIAAASCTSAFAQGRGRQHTPAITYRPLPETLKEVWDRVPVVRARVETVGSPRLSARKLVERLHVLRVVELLKGPSNFPKTFRLSLPGGSVSADGVELTTNYDREMVDVGDEALLFLTPMRETGVYALPFGPAGFFEASFERDPSQPMGSIRLQIPERAQHIRDLKGRIKRLAVRLADKLMPIGQQVAVRDRIRNRKSLVQQWLLAWGSSEDVVAAIARRSALSQNVGAPSKDRHRTS